MKEKEGERKNGQTLSGHHMNPMNCVCVCEGGLEWEAVDWGLKGGEGERKNGKAAGAIFALFTIFTYGKIMRPTDEPPI